jgi:hypothetical protein
LFVDEGIEVLLDSKVRRVEGHSSSRVRVYVNDPLEIALSTGPIFSSRPDAMQTARESASIKPAFSSTSAVTSRPTSGWRPPRKTSGRWAIARGVHNSRTSASTITTSFTRT